VLLGTVIRVVAGKGSGGGVVSLSDDDLKKFFDQLKAGTYPVLKRSTIYYIRSAKYVADGRGKLVEADFPAVLGKGDRDSDVTAKIGRLSGVAGDVGFHLLGDRFGGSTYYPNIIPANGQSFPGAGKNLNGSAYKKLENIWAKATGKGKPVEVDITMHYGASNIRPDTFTIISTIGGDDIEVPGLQNRAGVTIDDKKLAALNKAAGIKE
jgi:hypothetical protein